jgi:hypothetical protein
MSFGDPVSLPAQSLYENVIQMDWYTECRKRSREFW